MNGLKRYIVCSDLDGSLLDEQYRWEEAKPTLKQIKTLGIPLILNSSKTFAELQDIVQELDLETPVVCENGGVVGIPENSPVAKNLNEPSFMGYVMMYPGVNRKFLLQVAHKLRSDKNYLFQGFADWSEQEISDYTGLSLTKASRAKRRHATEPIRWEDTPPRREQFEADLRTQGIRMLQGGQFSHIMGQVDKSEGLRLILHLYQQAFPDIEWTSIALGDSANDLEMLSAADIAGVIPDKTGASLFPSAKRILYTKHSGPKGWNEIIKKLLKEQIER